MPTYRSYGPLDSQILVDGDAGFARMNARMRPEQLQPGEVAYSQNGRMGTDGAWQTRKGIDYFAGAPTSSSEALVVPFYVYANVTISTATRSTDTVTVTTSGTHSFNDASQVGIDGLTGIVDPNGNRTITVTGATTFTFTISGATGSESYAVGAGAFAGASFIQAINGNWGSCAFSDPSAYNSQYIVEAQTEGAVAISLTDGSSTTIDYPSGLTVTERVEMRQAFDKVYIFRDGATALEWDGDLSGSPAFTKVANGGYTQPTVFTANHNAVASGGVVTVTETSHSLPVGAAIKVFDAGTTGLLEDLFYTVASAPTANTFTFYADVDDFTATSIVVGKAQSQGLGFTHMPAPPWAAYHQRRIICPYFYTTTGSSGSEVITDRNKRDEIVFSDILDADTYDVLEGIHRVTGGIADYVQFVHPFTDDNAVVFNRNSIHLISGISGSIADISIKEITREAGLVARRSVVTIGNEIFFLSDNGIYGAEFGDLYNLRGSKLPASESIQPVIDRINWEYAADAVATYYDNRYWIALPLDESRVNNAVLIYNLLNSGWESVDIIDDSNWDVQNLIAAGSGDSRGLYAVTSLGGIHQFDVRDDDVDRLALQAGITPVAIDINSYVTSRGYTGGTEMRKRFREFQLHLESSSSNKTDGTITGIAENLDSEFQVDTIAGLLGAPLDESEDASLRGRIGGVRAHVFQLKIQPTQGRPKIRQAQVFVNAEFQSLTQAT